MGSFAHDSPAGIAEEFIFLQTNYKIVFAEIHFSELVGNACLTTWTGTYFLGPNGVLLLRCFAEFLC